MNTPTDRKYSKSHEWIMEEGDHYVLGLTDFAQHSMGEIVYVELPEEGDELHAQESFAEAESVKAVSEIFSPIEGKVLELNEALEDQPALINEQPYDTWLVKIEGTIEEELLDAAQYDELCEQEG